MSLRISLTGAACLLAVSALGGQREDVRDRFRAPAAEARECVRGFLWLEAEQFADYGHWKIDTQFVDRMGSAYLMTRGVLKPGAPARTSVTVPRDGTWRAWVRTKDWLPEFSPGAFALSVGGTRSGRLGVSGKAGWRWELAGDFALKAGKAEVRLEDLAGAYARCDALLLTTDLAYAPPADGARLADERRRLTGADAAVADGGEYDVIVVGAGPGGLGSALAAARTGAKTLLVHDRPVLGGNNSAEQSVSVGGTGNNRRYGAQHTREGGILEESRLMRLTLRGDNEPGVAYLRMTAAEPNLTVRGNLRATGVEKTGSRIAAVQATETLTGRRVRYRGKMFVDATGDGWIGVFADAARRRGREGRDFAKEKYAPETADDLMMSGCLDDYRFHTTDRQVAYETPAWARVIPEGFDRPNIRDLRAKWWLEHDASIKEPDEPERARDELIRISLGYWGWLRSHPKLGEKARRSVLDEVMVHLGRRDGWRLEGDYVLTEHDCRKGRRFPDAIGVGGWGLDLHDPRGVTAADGNGRWSAEQIRLYDIPFRSIYSKNVDNLLMAGRDISVSHAAFGSTRIMGTCFSVGQAAGTAAALAVRRKVTPRELGAKHIKELQQRLLRDDCFLWGVRNEDPLDLARKARVTASSWANAESRPENVIDGRTRPEIYPEDGNSTHAWHADPKAALPQELLLEFPDEAKVAEVRLTFDSGLTGEGPAKPMPPTLVKDYAVEVRVGGTWREVIREKGNFLRLRVHRFAPVTCRAIRVVVSATHGAEARIQEVRAYGPPASAAEIVLPAHPLMTERYAADELAYHIGKATGAKLPVVYEDEVPAETSGHRFYVGATEAARRIGLFDVPFAPDEHHVKSLGHDLYFVGGDKDGREIDAYWSSPAHGTMDAVYDFLEHEMGVRWLWPGESGEVIPRLRKIPIGGIDRRAKEKLLNRQFPCERHGPDAIGWADVAHREKFDLDQRRFLLRHRCGNPKFTAAGHAFWTWWERYGKTHPEFFMEGLDGTRGPVSDQPGDTRNVSMCVSSPALHKAIVNDWAHRTGRDPNGEHYQEWINCMENDSPGMCLCANCRAWDAPDPRFAENDYWSRRLKTVTRREYWEKLACVKWGESDGTAGMKEPPSVSDRYVRFYNAVLAEARKEHPDAQVIGYAYANYLEPPKVARVAKGVNVEYVPRMFFPYDKSCSDLFRKWWKGWNDAGAERMIYRPNYMLAGGNLPLNQARIIADDFAFAWRHGMRAAYFDSQMGAWSAHAVMNYTVYRMLREPDIGYARVLDEFCAAFGPAAKDIRAYCDHVETVGRGLSAAEYQRICLANPTPRGGAGGGNQTFMLIAPDILSEEFFACGRAILAAAERKAGDDAALRGRIRFLEEGLEESCLTYRARVADKGGDKAAFGEAFGRLVAYRAKIESHGVCNFSYFAQCERNNAGWPHQWTGMKGARPDLVEKVMKGELKQAWASWWGYDPVDATRCLQAAIDSKVPRLVVDPRLGPWNVTGLRGVSNQEIFFMGEVTLAAKEGGSSAPLLDLSGAHDVHISGFGMKFETSAAPTRPQLSLANARRVRIEGSQFVRCPPGGVITNGAVHVTFRECRGVR